MKHSKREIQTQKRECVFQQLFLSGFYPSDDQSPHLALFLDDTDLLGELELGLIEEMPPEEREELKTRCEAIFALLPDLDNQINAGSEDCKTNRMSSNELTNTKLALNERAND